MTMSTSPATPESAFFPQQLAHVREIGDRSDPYWTAAYADQSLVVEPGEQVLWHSTLCRLTVGDATFDSGYAILSDRRLAVVCHAFDQGSTYGGLGAAAVLGGLAATVVSHRRAAARRRGRVLVGQVRHEWVTRLELHRAASMRGSRATVHLVARTARGEQRLVFAAAPAVDHGWASWAAAVVAAHRLRRGAPSPDAVPGTRGPVSPQDEQLSVTAAGRAVPDVAAATHTFAWPLPGVTPQLVARAYADLQQPTNSRT